jgi:hypothetical protein
MSKEDLRKFLDAEIDGNGEQAQVHFHNYLEDKMKSILNPSAVEVEDSESDDSDVADEE